MPEFIVALRSGQRFTVKADRFRFEGGYLALSVAPPPSVANNDPFAGVVGLFEKKQVLLVVTREHLVAEEKGEPIQSSQVVGVSDDDPIPF
jgi:hypothetical protein